MWMLDQRTLDVETCLYCVYPVFVLNILMVYLPRSHVWIQGGPLPRVAVRIGQVLLAVHLYLLQFIAMGLVLLLMFVELVEWGNSHTYRSHGLYR